MLFATVVRVPINFGAVVSTSLALAGKGFLTAAPRGPRRGEGGNGSLASAALFFLSQLLEPEGCSSLAGGQGPFSRRSFRIFAGGQGPISVLLFGADPFFFVLLIRGHDGDERAVLRGSTGECAEQQRNATNSDQNLQRNANGKHFL